jgi:hypothetical protein
LVGSTARGAIIFDSGTLNGTASSPDPSALLSIPPPITMTATAESSISASVSTSNSAYAEGSASLLNNRVSIDGFTTLSYRSGFAFVSAGTNGVINFHETTGQFLRGSLGMGPFGNGGTQYGFANVTVRDAGNHVIMQIGGGGTGGVSPATPITLFFPPGKYSVSWSHGTNPIVGQGGQSSMSFNLVQTVPEPATLALLALPAMLLGRRRSGAA